MLNLTICCDGDYRTPWDASGLIFTTNKTKSSESTMEINCNHCGLPFKPSTKKAVNCSKECSKAATALRVKRNKQAMQYQDDSWILNELMKNYNLLWYQAVIIYENSKLGPCLPQEFKKGHYGAGLIDD